MEVAFIMEQRSVSRLEIITDLEDIIREIKSSKYSSITLFQGVALAERRVSDNISESYQASKQITIILSQDHDDCHRE